jgi:lysophospholipase L1-like esterase
MTKEKMKPLVLAIGSSILEQWPDLPSITTRLTIKNIAIGGTTTDQWLGWVNEKIIPHSPYGVLFYCGSNDFNQGASHEAIFQRTIQIVERIQFFLPEAKLMYLHIIKAPQKKDKWPELDLLAKEIESNFLGDPRLKILDPNQLFFVGGKPRRELFIEDELHLTKQAYAQWAKWLQPELEQYFISASLS